VRRAFVAALFAIAVLATAAGASARWTVEPNFRFDLATASIDGHALLGKKVSEVFAALGRAQNRSLRHKRYGSVRYSHGALSVMFRLRGRFRRVTSIAITAKDARETRLGRVLRLDPDRIQQRIVNTYGATFRLTKRYGCSHGHIEFCGGLFKSIDGKMNLSFGSKPTPSGTRSYIVLYV
jgi:hypothetical protein